VKEYIVWIATSLLVLITPVREYIITCELLIVLNWIAHYYVVIYCKTKRKKIIPVYVQMFFVTVTILIARHIDGVFMNNYETSHVLSLGLVFYELGALYKNISLLLGFDITKYINKK
jgi:hypothetical protein